MSAAEPIEPCDYILVVATSTEEERLLQVAAELGIEVVTRRERLAPELKARPYYSLGALNNGIRVHAIKVEMGAHGYRGSAAMAMRYKTVFEAQGVICLGTAFGIDRSSQQLGDVLVSRALLPYDARDVECPDMEVPVHPIAALTGRPPRPRYRYGRVGMFPSNEMLYRLFETHQASMALPHRVHFGALLTGGVRVLCGTYRDELVAGVTEALRAKRAFSARPLPPIIGGEMEGVGLLSVCHPDRPEWIIVKGISDFGDARDREPRDQRTARAAENSARYVLSTLRAAAPRKGDDGND